MHRFKRWIIFLSFSIIFFTIESCEKTNTTNHQAIQNILSFDTVKAWDITTFAAWKNSNPTLFDSSGNQIQILEFAKKVGVNTIRLRILNGTQQFPHATISQLLALSKQAYQNNIAIWLDFHYSDVWADPGNQTVPKQWEGLTLENLCDSVESYTYHITNLFVAQGTPPAIVQIGNEISPGMMWPIGKFNGAVAEAKNVTSLFLSGANGVKRASKESKIMLHLAGNSNTIWWVGNEFLKAGITFDLWGFSYYGNWNGCDTKAFMQTCDNLSRKNSKYFVIAETAYPHTLNWQDQMNNVFGLSDQLCTNYTATEIGQFNWLHNVWSEGSKFSNFRGLGYWEPAWVTDKNGNNANGSPWENMGLFDFEHKALKGAYFNWK
jgi:arabinogalactan endo-1,4-beta-galactosidase